MSQSNFDRLLQKYLAGECTEEEEKLVLEWYESMIRNSDLHLSEADKSLIEDRLWQNIRTNVQSATTAKQQVPIAMGIKTITARTWLRIAAVAATVTVVATAIILWWYEPRHMQPPAIVEIQPGYDSVVNKTTGMRSVQLADSTLITLQPGATLYYPPVFTGATREVYLKGSAFFNVYHNREKHFKVHLNNGLTTEVLGTSFNIKQHKTNRDVEVAVVTGRVLVYQQQRQQVNGDTTTGVVLTRNKKVMYNAASNQLIAGIVDDPQPLPKTKQLPGSGNRQTSDAFNFEEVPLHNVLQTLSDAYGILITVENEELASRHFTGNLSTYSLFAQLEYICKSTQTIYEINGSQIIIKETRTGNNP